MNARIESEESQDAKYKQKLLNLDKELLLVKTALASARTNKDKIGIVVIRDLRTRVERKIENEKRFQAILSGKTYSGKEMGADVEFVPTAIRRKYDWRFTISKKEVEDRFRRYLGKETGDALGRVYSIDSIVYKNMYFLEQERAKKKKRRERERKRSEKEALVVEKEKEAKKKKELAEKLEKIEAEKAKKKEAKEKERRKRALAKAKEKKKLAKKKIAEKKAARKAVKKPIKKKLVKKPIKGASKKRK